MRHNLLMIGQRKEPHTDFEINANGTLNLLEACKLYSPKASFIFMSTNKVYGDASNSLNFIEKKTRYELKKITFIKSLEYQKVLRSISQNIVYLVHQNYQLIY